MPLPLQPDPLEAPLARAESLARAFGAAMPGLGETTFAHLSAALPDIHEALQHLLNTQLEVPLESTGRIAGLAVTAPGYPTFLQALSRHGSPTLVLRRDTTPADLHALLEGVLRNPVDLEVMGGLRGYLERMYIQSIQIRCQEDQDTDLPAHLLQKARTVLQGALTPPDTYSWGTAGWLHYISDLRAFGPLGAELGLDDGPPPPAARALLGHVLDPLSPDQVISLGRGMGSLPRRPHGMVLLLQDELLTRLPNALRDLLSRGLHWLILHHPVEDLVAAFPGPLASLLGPLREGLADVLGDPLVQAFLEQLSWQAQNLRQQLDQTQGAETFLSLPAEARAQLLERCLKAHRLDALTDLLGELPELVQSVPEPALIAILESVRDFLPHTLGKLAPDYLMDSLETVLVSAYRRHPGEAANRVMREALVRLFEIRLRKFQALELKRLIDLLEIEDGYAAANRLMGIAPGWLRRELDTEDMLDLAIACVFEGDRLNSLTSCMPYFLWLDTPLFQRVAWRLGREELRHHRDRMLRVLTAGGEVAEATVALQLRTSIPWYYARNLLVVLATIGTPRTAPKVQPFLDHEDGRVRLAALRALRQCTQGRLPIPHLVGRLEDPDPAIRIEAIHLLASQRSLDVLRALLSVAQDRKVPTPVRLAAIEGLVTQGIQDAVPALRALEADKGGFLRKGEPEEIRSAAAQASARLLRGTAAPRT